jgi:tetratricopeptide (TPR) repeat protein
MPEVLYFEDTLPLFNFPFIPFSVIAALGLPGLIVLLRRGRARGIVCLYIGAALLSVLLFYVNTRYRLPIVPVVIILAAIFAVSVAGDISRRRLGRAASLLALSVLVFLLVSNRTIIRANRGSVYTFLGTYYLNRGEADKAAEAFATAYRIDPDRDTSMVNHARMLMTQGRYEQAARIYSRAYELNPNYPKLAVEYAFTLQKLGRQSEARSIALELYSSGSPNDRITACKLLATAAFFEGNRDELMRWIEAGLELAPDDPDLNLMLESVDQMPQR